MYCNKHNHIHLKILNIYIQRLAPKRIFLQVIGDQDPDHNIDFLKQHNIINLTPLLCNNAKCRYKGTSTKMSWQKRDD
jgi:hypothetical protein